MSKRQAARRAGISEGRWRQIVAGYQSAGGGHSIPVNPKRETLLKMAAAVGADRAEVLRLAGMTADPVVGGVGDADDFVSAPGERVEAGVSNQQVLEEIRAMRRRMEELEKRMGGG